MEKKRILLQHHHIYMDSQSNSDMYFLWSGRKVFGGMWNRRCSKSWTFFWPCQHFAPVYWDFCFPVRGGIFPPIEKKGGGSPWHIDIPLEEKRVQLVQRAYQQKQGEGAGRKKREERQKKLPSSQPPSYLLGEQQAVACLTHNHHTILTHHPASGHNYGNKLGIQGRKTDENSTAS